MWKNRMFKRSLSFVLVIFIIGAASGQLNAQDNTSAKSGSFYSSIGFGSPADVHSPETMGLGLPGVSTYSGFSPNIANPGHWGLIRFTQGNLALGLNTFDSVDNSASSKNTLFGIESFQFAIDIFRFLF